MNTDVLKNYKIMCIKIFRAVSSKLHSYFLEMWSYQRRTTEGSYFLPGNYNSDIEIVGRMVCSTTSFLNAPEYSAFKTNLRKYISITIPSVLLSLHSISTKIKQQGLQSSTNFYSNYNMADMNATLT